MNNNNSPKKNLWDKMEAALKKNCPDLFDQEKGQLIRGKVRDAGERGDELLIKTLLQDPSCRKYFFKSVESALLFQQKEFLAFIDAKHLLDNSYTSFKNKIGLAIGGGGKFLNALDEVVLAWPYKDCILEGGMTKEDRKRDEIFFNQALAKDEIYSLLDDKVLTNAQRYDKAGSHPVTSLNQSDNLIIKGNNLLALHCLKKQFARKVKLIYIDPPYNTQNDPIKYNDKFNHSTWLTFMKNRLEVARELLRDDGVIFVQCDDNEQAYLKVLMDELFGRENFITILTCKVKAPSGISSRMEAFFDCAEYITGYAKNKNLVKFTTVKTDDRVVDEKAKKIIGAYRYIFEEGDHKKETVRKIKDGTLYYVSANQYKFDSVPKGQSNVERYYYDNYKKIFRLAVSERKFLIESIKEQPDPDGLYIYSYTPQKGINRGKKIEVMIYKKSEILFLKDYTRKDDKNKCIVKQELISNIFTRDWWQGISNEGGVELKKGKKPEKLLETLLNIFTEKEDLVLDYNLGSGTTTAVAHKMGRQYIGIEQLDYIEDLTLKRMNNVLQGEQHGISKSLNWKGGGDFIYFELKQYNQVFIEQIEKAGGTAELEKIWQEMKQKSFLDWNVDIQKEKEAFTKWKKLSLTKQKQALIELLDKNQLYVNYSAIEDKDFACSDAEKEFSESFYGKKKDAG